MGKKPAIRKEMTKADDAPLTPADEAVLRNVLEEMDAQNFAPNLKMEFNDETRHLSIRFDHENPAVGLAQSMIELGIVDDRVFGGLLAQLSALGEQGHATSEKATNFALGVIASIKPRDTLEAMLAAQMAATHQASMMMARRLTHVETIPQQDAAERAFNKLNRTYATQMTTLKKYRATAQQTVRVERVEVNDGGQAVVGDLNYRRGADDKS